MLAFGTKTGTKVTITIPAKAKREHSAFSKAFSGVVGKLIRFAPLSLDRKMYPETFAIVGIGKDTNGKEHNAHHVYVDTNWLTVAS